MRRVRRKLRRGVFLAATAAAAGACSPLPPLPLRPEPVPYADTLPVPEPAPRERGEVGRIFETALGEEITRPVDVRRLTDTRHEALNVTRFDEVVPSAWFEPRNGRERLTPREVFLGATDGVGPDTSGPLRVVAGKAEGISPGFTVEDARGDRYLFKFDPKGHLHLASSADIVSSRLFWAAGYHTPEDHKVVFDPGRLVLDPEAEVTTATGRERAMTRDDVRGILELTDSLPDGRYLALASKFLPGTPKGPFLFSGTRGDDPNDHYHHEFRRELRGLHVVSAWLNHVDMRFQNTLDVYVAPGYLKHHLIDFAATLGSGTIRPHEPREGMEYNFDLWPTLARIATLGFYRTGWEGADVEPIAPSVGWMPVESFDPASWKANWPNPAFSAVTPRDGYWGAKLVGSFSDAQIRAAVEAAGLPTASAADTLVEILRLRRDRTVTHWYGKVTPLEEVTARRAGGGETLTVRFRDLGLDAGVWTPEETTYRWSFRHPERGISVEGRTGADPGPGQAISIPGAAGGEEAGGGRRERLAVLEVAAVRPGAAARAATIYLERRGPREGYAVAGLAH